MYMVHLFEDSNLCAIHAKRVTIMVKCAAATPRICYVCAECALFVRCVCAVCALCAHCICAACAQRLLCVCAVCAHTYYAPTMRLLTAYTLYSQGHPAGPPHPWRSIGVVAMRLRPCVLLNYSVVRCPNIGPSCIIPRRFGGFLLVRRFFLFWHKQGGIACCFSATQTDSTNI